ncbi:MAG: 3-hydroxybutyryl-CoA dehydrogenase [Myxococcales bacterium]|nr:3-hydroxybutyryl-CoA dehydrogenase [Deltaproteobacteria bacterium]NNE20179.1 3-hydroxybutyryl-CoA dehydrogenase [Myxococcales bacterium]
MSVTTNIRCVGVVGAGQMGRGIAQVMAASGLRVRLLDSDTDVLNHSLALLRRDLSRSIEKGRMKPEERDALLSRIVLTTDIASFVECDFAVEAATEDQAVKRDIFRELDHYTPEHAILASNTSSISLTKLAGVTGRPERVIGMHFMNPVPRMPLVEIIRALQTSDATYEVTSELARRLGKTCITTKDMPGFVVNRMLIPFINEACFVLQEGLCTVEDIDQASELGLSHPMGPLKLADLIGLDTCLAIAEVLQRELGEDKYRPPAILRNYVAAGWLGRKTGRGFYEYDTAVERQRKVA